MKTFFLLILVIILCACKIIQGNQISSSLNVESSKCPAAQLSGLEYERTSVSLEGAEVWLREHKKDLDSLNFVPTSKPKTTGGIMPTSMKIAEEREKQRKAYNKAHITNDVDFDIRIQLDMIDKLIEKNPKKAHNKFNKLYQEFKSPRALFGLAVSLNKLAMASSGTNEAAKLQGIAADKFCQVMSLNLVPLFLFMSTGRTCLELRRHRQERGELIKALKMMKSQFPNAFDYASELAYEYLKQRKFAKAIDEMRAVLNRWPQKAGKERVLMGIVFKWQQSKGKSLDWQDHQLMEESLSEPLRSYVSDKVSQSILSLTDFYEDYGFSEEASFFQQIGVQLGVFPSKWQRQLYDNNFYINGLTSRPVWQITELPKSTSDPLKEIAKHWQTIRNEGLEALFGDSKNYQDEVNQLQEEGQWQQLVLFEKSFKNERGCNLAPKTCKLIEKWMSDSAVSCSRGQVKFSVMHKGTHVWPHSGPTNTRLRAHLGLVVPSNGRVEMRIANERVRWSAGKIFVIDDSFEHEVWHQGDTIRLVLLVDFWHPDLSVNQRQKLPPLPIDDSKNRTTVFNIAGIVSQITSSVTSDPVQNRIEAAGPRAAAHNNEQK